MSILSFYKVEKTTYIAVVRGESEEALASPEFGVLENRTEREINSQLLSAHSDLKT